MESTCNVGGSEPKYSIVLRTNVSITVKEVACTDITYNIHSRLDALLETITNSINDDKLWITL